MPTGHFEVCWFTASCDVCGYEAEPRQLSRLWTEFPSPKDRADEVERLLKGQGFIVFGLLNGYAVVTCPKCWDAFKARVAARAQGGDS